MDWRFWRWTQRDNDLNDEIAHDLAAEAEERIRAGISREEAELASRRDFGSVSLLKEDVREIGVWASLQRLAQDLRYGWRTLRSNVLFTAMAVLSLALGIGANTAIYSVMDTVMLRALPVKNAGELAILNWRAKSKQEPAVVRHHNGANYRAAAEAWRATATSTTTRLDPNRPPRRARRATSAFFQAFHHYRK
jgi:macrolide transport system ATP-binding/permease protein